MPEIYADWKSLKPLTKPVPVGTKCVVIKRIVGDMFSKGEIVTTIDYQEFQDCKNSDGIVDFLKFNRLALLPADYKAEPKAEQKPERKIVQICSSVNAVLALCDNSELWSYSLVVGDWQRIPPIPQD